MDNITHAFVGAAIAECALPGAASRITRRVFLAAGVAAATAPDIDLLYSGITLAPLGYLLHHRGHSHTLPGLIVLGLLLVLVCRAWPAARDSMRDAPVRFATLVAVALLSHLALDAGNSYGTHLLYPLTSAWYYGDAVFIFEPWLWLLLGVAVAQNTGRAWLRRTVWLLVAAPAAGLAVAGLIPPAVLVVLAAAGAALAVGLAPRRPVTRAAVALAASLFVCLSLFGLSRLANARVRQAVQAIDSGVVVDVVLNPNPAVPWCWSLLTVESVAHEPALLVRRGTLSLLPGLMPAAACASHRLLAADKTPTPATSDSLLWNGAWRVDLAQLRSLRETGCRTRAWLQFGRVPFVSDGWIADLRFDNPLGGNFSTMRVDAPGSGSDGCPSNLTGWEPPRADVLGP